MAQYEIQKVTGLEILDSRGNPTVEAYVYLEDGGIGRGVAPSGASTGEHEAVELRDGEKKRYGGKGTTKAVKNIEYDLNQAVRCMDARNLYEIDMSMRRADGTANKGKLGANAMLAVSMATADAMANSLSIPLFQYLAKDGYIMPVPMMNILNGGAHAKNSLDVQEFMIMPVGAISFREALRMGVEIYHKLKKLLEEEGESTGVGDEGGFAPDLHSTRQALDFLVEATREAGFEPGTDIVFALDVAASELYNKDSGLYIFRGENQMRDRQAMIDYYKELCDEYPICSIEDGLDQNDWDGWEQLTREIGDKVQLVGDDLFVTNVERLEEGINRKAGNAILIKPNQIGTISETIDAVKKAKHHGYKTIMSHRSGETEDTFIADLAVALNCGQIKTGAPCRGERVAKYNRLLRIEHILGEKAVYAGELQRREANQKELEKAQEIKQ